MVRVERACVVYVRFVSAILALADARSVFDVARSFSYVPLLSAERLTLTQAPRWFTVHPSRPWSPPCHALSATSPPVPHAGCTHKPGTSITSPVQPRLTCTSLVEPLQPRLPALALLPQAYTNLHLPLVAASDAELPRDLAAPCSSSIGL
jgi:hypothetical protein